MVDLHDSSDAESLDSDEELQQAFASGDLKGGLNIATAAPKQYNNNVAGMKQKLAEIRQKLDWLERLDITTDPAPPPPGTETMEEEESGETVHHDFKRELRFYRQAQATVLSAIPRLHKCGITTKRPEDYFAEMAKSDSHMKKVRARLLEKQQSMEHREKARKLRDLRKYGKKVQQEVLLKRQKEKREMLDAVKQFRKGQKDKLDFLEETDPSSKKGGKGKGKQKGQKSNIPNQKRQFKDKKFGFGGQKKRSKLNTKESAGDMSSFNHKVHQGRPGFNKKKQKGGKQPRLGKSRRQGNKNKNKRR